MEAARRTPGRAVLLFVTGRCPVGCAHCSVDSRRDSPGPADLVLFEELVEGIAGTPGIVMVGITGGEPFTARRALVLAAGRLAAAGKLLVLYTSGVWATSAHPPAWITEVLGLCSCVVLSTDSYHSDGVPPERFARAARAVCDAGACLVVQTLDAPGQAEAARLLLARAFGPGWRARADLRQVPLLGYGRGAGLTAGRPAVPGGQFGRCTLASAPVVRYDGRISACCNEAVIMGAGPAALRRTARTRQQVRSVLTSLAADPYLTAIGSAGLGPLTAVAGWRDLAARPFPGICALCWRMLRTAGEPGESAVLALLAGPSRSERAS